VFEGPNLVQKIKDDLESLLEKDGYANLEQAIGADHQKQDAKAQQDTGEQNVKSA